MTVTAAEFMQSAPAPLAGNTPWAARYAAEMRSLVVEYANGSARNVQRHLGPSELGASCHRQVAGKLAQLPPTNHVLDPWASIMGTAGHTWMEGMLHWANTRGPRFLPEHRVTPLGFEDHPGTSDGYDAEHAAVLDWKFLGTSSLAKLRAQGPPRHYRTQFLVYRRGFLALGLPVRRIILVAWPRTASSLDSMYVWEHEVTDGDERFLDEVIAPELAYRKQWAAALVAGVAQLSDVPMDPADECQFCPYYRPQTARDGGPGCPGHASGQQYPTR